MTLNRLTLSYAMYRINRVCVSARGAMTGLWLYIFPISQDPSFGRVVGDLCCGGLARVVRDGVQSTVVSLGEYCSQGKVGCIGFDDHL